LRSGSAHCDLEFAVEVWQLRPGDARGDLEFAVGKEGRREEGGR